MGAAVVLPSDAQNCRVPDVTAVAFLSDGRWIWEPRLVADVVSRKSRATNIHTDLAFYRDIETLDEILQVHLDRRHVILWQRDGGRWIVQDFVARAEVHLRMTTSPMQLDELYEPLGL